MPANRPPPAKQVCDGVYPQVDKVGPSALPRGERRTRMKNVHSPYSCMTGSAQVGERVFDQDGALRADALVSEDVAHERHRGFGTEVAVQAHVLNRPDRREAAQQPQVAQHLLGVMHW